LLVDKVLLKLTKIILTRSHVVGILQRPKQAHSQIECLTFLRCGKVLLARLRDIAPTNVWKMGNCVLVRFFAVLHYDDRLTDFLKKVNNKLIHN
jgi:hypothetical protein